MKHCLSLALALSFATGLSAPATAAAAPRQTQPPKPTRVRAKLDGFDLSPKSGKSANQIGGASRDLGTPRLYAPALGKAYSLTPTFYWTTADGASKVTFTLTTINGVQVYSTVTTDAHLTYPGDAPALTPGTTYRWTVIPENDMMGGAPTPAAFQIISGDERTLIANELAANADPATVFVNHRLWYDSVSAYTAVLDKDPGNQVARQGRATLYSSIDVTQPLADSDWQMVH